MVCFPGIGLLLQEVQGGVDEFALGPEAAGRELLADEPFEVGRELMANIRSIFLTNLQINVNTQFGLACLLKLRAVRSYSMAER